MNSLIAYPLESGQIAVVGPNLGSGLTVEEIAAKDVPTGLPFLILAQSEFPTDTSFRDAWEIDFNDYQGVTVSLYKSKTIYKQVADARAASLSAPLTQEYMRLVAIEADTTAVQAQLKAINAAAEETAYLDATTVPQLVACWPAELGPNPFLPAVSAE